MNRWILRAASASILSCASLAFAQTVSVPSSTPGFVREAPAGVKAAIISVSATPPVITVNGVPDRFSPGVRIRDRNNMLVLTGALAGRELYTVYKRDPAGLVHEVWLLDATEFNKVSGLNVGDPEGYKRFNELLALIFGTRP